MVICPVRPKSRVLQVNWFGVEPMRCEAFGEATNESELLRQLRLSQTHSLFRQENALQEDQIGLYKDALKQESNLKTTIFKFEKTYKSHFSSSFCIDCHLFQYPII